jgi:hypothetical protein
VSTIKSIQNSLEFNPTALLPGGKPQNFKKINESLTKKEDDLINETDDDLFKPKIKTVVSKPLDLENETTDDDLFKPVVKKTSPEVVSSIKSIQNSLAFNPASLLPGGKPHNLNKINEVSNKKDDDLLNETTDDDLFKPVVKKATPEVVSSIKSIQNSLAFNPAALLPGGKPQNLNKINEVETKKDDDPFSLDVDRTFNDQSIRNAQKDRIKVAQKKRPPKGRAVRTEDPVDVNDNIDFGFDEPLIQPAQPKEEPLVKPKDEPLFKDTKSSLDLNNDDLDLFKTTTSIPKSVAPIDSPVVTKKEKSKLDKAFDDDIDLFADVSLLTNKETKSVVEQQPATEIQVNKKKKSNLDSVFKDDTDLFADVDLLGKSSKKEKQASSISTLNKSKKIFSGKFIEDK